MKEAKLQQNISFFNSLAKHYDWPLFQFWMKGFHKPVLAEIDVSQKLKILDVSCGTGELLVSLVKKDKNQNLQLYGVDIAEKMLRKAREKLASSVRLQKADVHKLKFPEHSFDYVISTESFHHYSDQQKALQEMVRVAKKGGKVIVVDINFFFRGIHWLFETFEPGCVKVNNKKEMRKLFEQAHLKNIKQERSFLFAVMTTGIKS